MLKNYFKLAWRSLLKKKLLSFINMMGLALGIAFALLLSSYVIKEWLVNSELRNIDNQYVILSKWKDPNLGTELNSIAELSRQLKYYYPDLVANYYNSEPTSTVVTKGNLHCYEALQVGDSTMFDMFGLRLKYGSPSNALKEPYTVVITSQTAIKYFNRYDVVGELLNLQDLNGTKHDFTVTGVLDEIPDNSVTRNILNNIEPGFYLNSNATRTFRYMYGWHNQSAAVHVELQKGATPEGVEAALKTILKKYAPENVSANLTPYLVPLKDYNLVVNNALKKKLLWTLSSIAFFIMLMAVVNFVNICIGRSSERIKEMGMRKVLGGLRQHLIWQFMTESILLVFISTLLALAICLLATPYFTHLLGTSIWSFTDDPGYLLVMTFLLAVLIGFIAGIYPALVLSKINPVDSLKGKVALFSSPILFQRFLIGFQFFVAGIVLVSALVISQQVEVFFSSNLGFNKDFVIYTRLPKQWSTDGVQSMVAARNQLAQMPQVKSISLSLTIPDGEYIDAPSKAHRQDYPSNTVLLQTTTADNQFANTYTIPVRAGVFLKPYESAGNSLEVVINETALKGFGWTNPQHAIGRQIMIDESIYNIRGVIADFNFSSMSQKIKPLAFKNVAQSSYYRYFSVKLNSNDLNKSILALKQKWTAVLPQAPFEYHFMDEALERLYATEMRLKKAAYVATGLAILIAMLGVLGLASLSINKRIKEIGIRKVLGASRSDISWLFLKDFLILIIVGALLAFPPTLLGIYTWLNSYAYRISITPWPFIISAAFLIIATVLLIILQTSSAAASSPVKQIRNNE